MDASIIKVTFENGTRDLIQGQDGSIEIGTRMLYQLKGNGVDWGSFSNNVENQCKPGEVIEALAQGRRRLIPEC